MNQVSPAIPPAVRDLKSEFKVIHDLSAATFERSFDAATFPQVAKSFLFVTDLAAWKTSVLPQPESVLYERAEREYMTSLINLTQGQYSNAFKGLRLVLELTIQGSYLSANIIELQEWLRNSADTNWSTLMSPDKGPISKRFCDAFFPEMREHAESIATMARTLYRELSETIHGNIPQHIPHPESFAFNKDAFDLWHAKAETARLIVIFCLSVRYIRSMEESKRAVLEPCIIDQLGHIEAIRTLLGGPATK